MTPDVAPPAGRRARNKHEKQQRILAAASALFASHGFEGVTTQQIAEEADVAAGTLFRYASSKGELFLMAYNQAFADALAVGRAKADAAQNVTDAVVACVEPVVTSALGIENAAVYQRELLFGSTTDAHRSEGLALVLGLERDIARRLRAAVADPAESAMEQAHTEAVVAQAAERAARTVFAVLNLLLVQPLTKVHDGDDVVTELRAQVRQAVAGFLATVRDAVAPSSSATPKSER